MMRKFLSYIIIIVGVCGVVFSQEGDFMKMIDKKEFSKIPPLMLEVYKQDTNRADYYNIWYNYYIDKDNEKRDSLSAYFYLKQYNKITKKKTDTKSFAQSLLANLYREKNIDKFNMYILLTEEYEDLNKEANRIRDVIAYETLQENPSIENHRKFLNSYPNATQKEDVLWALNDMLLKYYIEKNNLDSLKIFAQKTTSDTYKSKALREIDRISFTKALKENSVDSYKAYIQEFPDGDYLKRAKSNMEKVQYENEVLHGNIDDLISYLNNHTQSDKNYNEVLGKLSFLSLEKCNLKGMQKVYELQKDDKFLRIFAKKYIADLEKDSIENLIAVFDFLSEDEDIITAKHNAERLEALSQKENLTMADYSKNKDLFKTLNAGKSAKVFERFEQLNSSLPKNKKVDFHLEEDITYRQFLVAKNMEMNFILTDPMSVSIAPTDDIKKMNYFSDNMYRLSNPVWSADKQFVFFSCEKGMNFGGKDIYISVAEDDKYSSWSEPILLSEDFNTKDDDYVVAVGDNFIVLTQDIDFNSDNYIFLEGDTHFEFVKGKIIFDNNSVITDNNQPNTEKNILIHGSEVYVYDKQNLKLFNIVRPNDNGFFALIKDKKDVLFRVKKRGYISLLTDTDPVMYSVKDMVEKSILISFEWEENRLDLLKQQIGICVENMRDNDYILTLSLHCKTEDRQQVLQKELEKMLKGYNMTNRYIIKGYGMENTAQGYENKESIDVGLIQN